VAGHALAQLQVKIAKGEYLEFHEEKKLTFRQFAPEYLAYLGRDAVREGMELLDSISGPTEIRTRVSAVRGRSRGVAEISMLSTACSNPRHYLLSSGCPLNAI